MQMSSLNTDCPSSQIHPQWRDHFPSPMLSYVTVIKQRVQETQWKVFHQFKLWPSLSLLSLSQALFLFISIQSQSLIMGFCNALFCRNPCAIPLSAPTIPFAPDTSTQAHADQAKLLGYWAPPLQDLYHSILWICLILNLLTVRFKTHF